MNCIHTTNLIAYISTNQPRTIVRDITLTLVDMKHTDLHFTLTLTLTLVDLKRTDIHSSHTLTRTDLT